jgi:hypothetical protein
MPAHAEDERHQGGNLGTPFQGDNGLLIDVPRIPGDFIASRLVCRHTVLVLLQQLHPEQHVLLMLCQAGVIFSCEVVR